VKPFRLIRLLAAVSMALGAVGLYGGWQATDPPPARGAEVAPTIVVLEATGIVDQVMAGYLDDGVRVAGERGAAAVVIRIDTPGGALDATNRIVGSLLEAPLPTIVWVSPAGGRAASAGTFITLAAHLAYMAPGTNIGAATPVTGEGEDIPGALGEKVLNDAIAKIRAIAEERGRNVEWAIETVEAARSSPASEAVELGAVDAIATTLEDVIADADGRTVRIRGTETTVSIAGAVADELPMNPFQAFLHLLADPNIAFILFTIGFYGLFFELQNPNFVTGILGAMALILAFIGFGSLPLNVGGLLLIVLAVVLFFLEFLVTSNGLLAIGGLACFFLGASALYTEPGDPTGPLVGVAAPLLIVTTVTTAIFMGLIAYAAIRSRGMVSTPGLVGAAATISGARGVVRAPLGPLGSVYADGEEWSARTADQQPLERGTPVRIVGQEGLTLIVEAAPEPPADPFAAG
jgi:membrane-bound serine protease (ClpP class)